MVQAAREGWAAAGSPDVPVDVPQTCQRGEAAQQQRGRLERSHLRHGGRALVVGGGGGLPGQPGAVQAQQLHSLARPAQGHATGQRRPVAWVRLRQGGLAQLRQQARRQRQRVPGARHRGRVAAQPACEVGAGQAGGRGTGGLQEEELQQLPQRALLQAEQLVARQLGRPGRGRRGRGGGGRRPALSLQPLAPSPQPLSSTCSSESLHSNPPRAPGAVGCQHCTQRLCVVQHVGPGVGPGARAATASAIVIMLSHPRLQLCVLPQAVICDAPLRRWQATPEVVAAGNVKEQQRAGAAQERFLLVSLHPRSTIPCTEGTLACWNRFQLTIAHSSRWIRQMRSPTVRRSPAHCLAPSL